MYTVPNPLPYRVPPRPYLPPPSSSCMTADLLHLCDPAHPHSPVTSNDHTFWRALFPLPAEGEGKAEPRTPPGAGAASKASSASASTCGAAEPSSSSSSKAVATGGTACSPHGPTPVGTDTDTPGVTINITAAASVGAAAPPAAPTTSPSCHPGATPAPELLPPPWLPAPPRPSRFPAPPPALDVPAGFAPAGARDVDCVWLAPHHWVLQAPVFYTHADFCALGRGRWGRAVRRRGQWGVGGGKGRVVGGGLGPGLLECSSVAGRGWEGGVRGLLDACACVQ